MGAEGRGASGLPSSSTEGCAGSGRAVGSSGFAPVASGWPEELVVGERLCRAMGGGIASSMLDEGEEGMGEVGESGG